MRKLTFDLLLKNISERQHFTFSRWGDGEWNCVFGKKGSNCDGHNYFPDMGKELNRILKNKPKYYVGMQNLAMQVMGEKITGYLKENEIEKLNWCDADILHRASINGLLHEFFAVLNNVPSLMLVAPDYINDIQFFFNFDYQIVVPQKNCWLEHERIMNDNTNYTDKMIKNGHTVILFIASMASNVLIDRIYNLYGDKILV